MPVDLQSSLTRKLGPLPAWGWGVAIGGAIIGVRMLRGGSSAPSVSSGAPAVIGGGGEEQAPTPGSDGTQYELDQLTRNQELLQDRYDALSDSNQSILGKLTTLASRDATLSKQVSTLSSRNTTLTGQVSTLASKNAGLADQVKGLTTRITSATTYNTLQQQLIAALNKRISLMDMLANDRNQLNAIADQYRAGRITKTTYDQQVAAKKAEISSDYAQLATLNTTIATLTKKIAGIAA